MNKQQLMIYLDAIAAKARQLHYDLEESNLYDAEIKDGVSQLHSLVDKLLPLV